MGGQAKTCPTTEEVSPLGGACFSLPIHTGAHRKFHEIRSSETLLDASSPRFTGRRHECRRGTQECVRHMGQQPNVKLFLRDPLGSLPNPILFCQTCQVPPVSSVSGAKDVPGGDRPPLLRAAPSIPERRDESV